MNIENEIFKRYNPNKESLLKYGFIENNNQFTYCKVFLDSFKAEIIVEDEILVGKVIDLDLQEEYTNFRIENNVGTFSNNIKEEYEKILKDIRKKCFNKKRFISEQANRIAQLIFDKYKDEPYYEWEETPDYGVYKNKETKKWYGIIMNIGKDKINDGEGKIDVLNVKLDENKIKELIKTKKYFPAYHMNKKYWITIPLDNRISDQEIMMQIEESYKYAEGTTGTLLKNEWIVPANPKYYDVEGEFKKNKILHWKQSSDIKVGDIVYLYVGSPVSALRYKTRAIEVNIPYEYSDSNVKMSHVMRIEKIKEYDKKICPLKTLKEYGVTTIRGPRYMPKKLKEYLDKE